MADKARDPRAQAVLPTVASVWEKLANQRGYQRVSRHMVDLVYRLDGDPGDAGGARSGWLGARSALSCETDEPRAFAPLTSPRTCRSAADPP
jgi:hypothetical protein